MITAQSKPPEKTKELIQYFIEAGDVGRGSKDVYIGDKRVFLSFSNTMGRVFNHDIGKRMLYNEEHDHWSVENDEQFYERTGRKS